jgi:phosphoglucosamine mutase
VEKNLFGTDGIRRTVGISPLTADELPKLGRALARWALSKYGASPKILLGHDTRVSCAFIKAALESGLLLFPITIHDVQVLPTPSIAYLTKHGSYDCGIIISASHNPYRDNGIKIIDATTGKLNKDDELIISELFFNEPSCTDEYATLGSCTTESQSVERYIAAVTSLFPSDFLNGKTIVLDCANGATSITAQRCFEHCGAKTIMLENTPSGYNINENCGSLHPELAQKTVVEYMADAGFAFDGDGDRITAITQKGEIKEGDDIISLLLEHPIYKKTSTIVGTIMTNQGLEVLLHNQGKTLARTPVGDKYVTERLAQENALLGGEPSGHIILRDYSPISDGVFVALRLMETLALTNNWNMNSFTKYPQILISIPITVKKDLETPPLSEIIAASKMQLHNGRLVVRYSGTENIVRIMVEDANLDHAQSIGKSLAAALKQELT